MSYLTAIFGVSFNFENDAACVPTQKNLESATFLVAFLRRFPHGAYAFYKVSPEAKRYGGSLEYNLTSTKNSE